MLALDAFLAADYQPLVRSRGVLAPIYLMGATEYELLSRTHQTRVPMEDALLMRPYVLNQVV